MRSISPDSITKLATTTGTEPIFIIAVDWASNGAPLLYADRDITEGNDLRPRQDHRSRTGR